MKFTTATFDRSITSTLFKDERKLRLTSSIPGFSANVILLNFLQLLRKKKQSTTFGTFTPNGQINVCNNVSSNALVPIHSTFSIP